MKVVAIAGRSRSGKTTLIERMLPELVRRGLRVAVLKHTRHAGPETDMPGTDTRRFWDAGAACTVLVAGDRVARIERLGADKEPTLAQALAGLPDVDLALVEGWKHSDLQKIEVVRSGCSREPLPELQNRIAWATDVADLGEEIPTYALDDVVGLAEFVTQLDEESLIPG